MKGDTTRYEPPAPPPLVPEPELPSFGPRAALLTGLAALFWATGKEVRPECFRTAERFLEMAERRYGPMED